MGTQEDLGATLVDPQVGTQEDPQVVTQEDLGATQEDPQATQEDRQVDTQEDPQEDPQVLTQEGQEVTHRAQRTHPRERPESILLSQGKGKLQSSCRMKRIRTMFTFQVERD